MKNDFVTDVFYFRFNRKNNNIKKNDSTIFTFTSFLQIFTILMIILPIVVVNSLPDNEIELPKDVSNDYKNGLVKTDNLVTNDFIHGNNSYNNDDGFYKHLHRRRGGKNHHKKHKARKHTKLESKIENNANSDIKESTSQHKYNIEQTGNKFDYYPIEPVNIKYDPKEDEKIRFVLITGNDNKDDDDDNKPINEKKKKRKRNKRDVSIPNEENSIKLKRNIQPSNYQNEYHGQNSAKISSNNNLYNSLGLPLAGSRYKIAVRGLYHNTYTPKEFEISDKLLGLPELATRFGFEKGPIWDRRPNSITTSQKPITVPTTTRPPISLGVNPTPTTSIGPSNCVWAIVNCCSKNDLTIRYGCFEQIGCVGAFWDFNPCGDSWQRKAVEETDKFFEDEDF